LDEHAQYKNNDSANIAPLAINRKNINNKERKETKY
jgi:hypothetical protein